MKRSRSEIRRKAVTLPDLRFEGQELTSYSGLIVFQKLFAVLDLRGRLRRCFSDDGDASAPGRGPGSLNGPDRDARDESRASQRPQDARTAGGEGHRSDVFRNFGAGDAEILALASAGVSAR